ncbi:MAG: exosome complex exonuclease Rrp41 [Methanosarcinaceae archaeon]|nr:exosome complex exonuclease Rrp41 [Methanosarcinaceae archaeon]
MMSKPEKFFDENGLRLDGRRVDEIRPMKIEIGVLSRADGSCYLEWGNNKVLAGVFGPRELHPRRMQRPDTAIVRYRYNMAAFSVEDRIRPGQNRRATEISKVSREAFEPVVLTHLYPGAVIDVFAEILQADAGTRTAAINAATIALADAGIPMKGLISACAVGKVDGKLVLDLSKDEDNYGDADLPVAMTQDGDITLIQMDGNLTQDEFKEAMELVKVGCKQILEIQREALKGKFSQFDNEEIEPKIVAGVSESEVEIDEAVETDDTGTEEEVEDVEEDIVSNDENNEKPDENADYEDVEEGEDK